MQIQSLNPHPIRRTTRRNPTSLQLDRLSEVQRLLFSRRNKNRTATFELLQDAGFTPQWLRVRWTGGVGSYVVMRGNVLRVLVSATKSGLSNPRFVKQSYSPGLVDVIEIPGKRRGYRYGWCIEIRP